MSNTLLKQFDREIYIVMMNLIEIFFNSRGQCTLMNYKINFVPLREFIDQPFDRIRVYCDDNIIKFFQSFMEVSSNKTFMSC